jgi:hypothetical protein
MLRRRPARRLAALEGCHRSLVSCGHLRRGLSLRGVLLEIGELQLELVQQCAALRGLSELLVPQLLDREFELLDQQGPRLGLRFRGQPGRSLGAQHRLQRGHIVRRESITPIADQRITSRRCCPNCRSFIDSNPGDQPAACGRQVCCGIQAGLG